MITTLFARPGQKAVKIESEGDLRRQLEAGEGVLWIDLEKPDEHEIKILSDVFHFHQLAIDDCVQESHHPKVDDYGEYIYLVMHGAASMEKRGQVQTQELDLFLGKTYVVTHHTVPIRTVDETRKRVLELDGVMGRGADFLLYLILDDLAGSFVRTIESLDVELDQLETKVFKKPSNRSLAEIFAVKKDILALRRVVIPQREVLTRLSRSEFKVVSKEAQLYFRDVYDHAYRVAELTESMRDLVTTALETYLTVVSNRTNEIVKVLTVMSIILMSLSLLAGIYGMNVPLPLAGWGGTVFLIAGVMAALSGGLYLFFRTRKWL